MASNAKGGKNTVHHTVNIEACSDSSQIWVLKVKQLNEFFKESIRKHSWQPTEETLNKFLQHLTSHMTTFSHIKEHIEQSYATIVKAYNPNILTLISLIRQMVNKLEPADKAHAEVIKLGERLDAAEKELAQIKVDLDEDRCVNASRKEEPWASWDQWLEHVKAKSIVSQFMAVINLRNYEMAQIEKYYIEEALVLIPLDQEMLDDFLKNMNTFKENITRKRVTQESEGYEADIKNWINEGKKAFAASNTELDRLRKRADEEILRQYREQLKDLQGQMRERLQQFQTGDHDLEGVMVEYVKCHNDLDNLRGDIQELGVPVALLKERDSAVKEADKIITEAQKVAITLVKDKAKEIGSTELDTGDMKVCMDNFQGMVKSIRNCMKKVDQNKYMEPNNQKDARDALVAAQAQLEVRLINSLKDSTLKEHEPFLEKMNDLREEGKYKDELLSEFPSYITYGEFLDDTRSAVKVMGNNISESNRDQHAELKALQEVAKKTYDEAQKAYEKMLEEKMRKELAEKVDPIRDEAKKDFKDFKEHISAKNEGDAFPGEETLNEVRGKLGQHRQRLEDLKPDYDRKYHNQINKVRDEIARMDPQTAYGKAKEEFLARERKKFETNIESLVTAVKEKAKTFDVDMSGKKRDKADPGDQTLADIQGELDKAISDIENMKDFDDDENKKTSANAVTEITHMKEEVEQWHQEACAVHQKHMEERDKEKEEFLETLRVKSTAVEEPKTRFTEFLENVKNSHTEDTKQDLMLQHHFDEAMKTFDGCHKTLKQTKPPRDELKGELQTYMEDLLSQKQQCQTQYENWTTFNENQGNYNALKYALSDTKSSIDVLQQDAETGVVCIVKAGEMSRETLTCNTVDLQAFNTRGLELISNVVEVTADGDINGPLWIAVHYDVRNQATYKEPQMNIYDPDKMEWVKIKANKSKDQPPNLMETRVNMKTGVPLHLAVTYDAKTSVHLAGTKNETIQSPNDKKLKVITEAGTFARKTPMSIKATPLSMNHHLAAKKLLELPNEMAFGTSPILDIELCELPSESLHLTVPMTGNTEEQNSKKKSRHACYPESNHVSHLMLRYKHEGWKCARRVIDSRSKNDSTFNLDLKTSEFHQKRLTGLVIKTTPTTSQKTLSKMAEALTRSIYDYYGCFVLKQHETDKKLMHMVLSHRTHVDKMNLDPVYSKLTSEKFSQGPTAPSKEFHLKEGDKFEIYTDKNISFVSGGDVKSLTFHSNLPSSFIETEINYKDPYAQHSYDEYQGSVICCRKEGSSSDKMQICGEEVWKFSVSVPKEILSRDRTFVQAKNTNVLLTNDVLRELSAGIVHCREDFYRAYGVENKHVEKLKQKYPEDPEEQVFNMFRDVMKSREILGSEKIAKEIVKSLARVNAPEAENMLRTKVNNFFQEQDKRKQDDKMRQSTQILKESEETLSKWREIYRTLMTKVSDAAGIESDIKEIETQENSEKGQMDLAMSKWRENAGSAASGRALITALNKLKFKKEAERINDLWGAWTE